MQYVFSFCIILGFSFLGEALHALLPIALPASIYGLILLFLALMTKLIKLDQIKQTGNFLAGILSLLFVSPAVNLLECWDMLLPNALPILIIVVGSTLIVFGASGGVTQALMRRHKEADHD